MESLQIDGLAREEARNVIKKLPRNKEFVIQTLSDGRKMFVRTDGIKTSLENGEPVKDIDITVHYYGEPRRKISYLNDILIPLIQIEVLFKLSKKDFSIIINAIKDSIELTSTKEIFKKHPELQEFEKTNPTDYSLEFLLVMIKMLALQEDVNYWGINPKTGRPYEGRYKPLNAIKDVFLNEMPLTHALRKHMLF